jgi:hypothetical protein
MSSLRVGCLHVDDGFCIPVEMLYGGNLSTQVPQSDDFSLPRSYPFRLIKLIISFVIRFISSSVGMCGSLVQAITKPFRVLCHPSSLNLA